MLTKSVCTSKGLLVGLGDQDDVPVVVLDSDEYVPVAAVADVEGPGEVHSKSMEEALSALGYGGRGPQR